MPGLPDIVAAVPDAAADNAYGVAAATLKDARRWNAYVAAHPDSTFFHRFEWAAVVREAFGHEMHYLYAERAGEIVGILPLLHVNSRLFGSALISTPFCVYGGILASDRAAFEALESAACQLARTLCVDYLEMRNRERQHPNWPCRDQYVTFRRTFTDSMDSNLSAIPRKQRAMVRKGIQKELRAETDAGVDRLYAIYSQSVRNLGTPVFSKRYLAILRNTFGNDCEVLTVTHQDQAIASVMSFYFKNEVLPYYGGGTLAARPLAGNDFMYWEVMERARQCGKSIYDFGRSKRGTGAFDFKCNWGFEPTQLYYEYYLVKAQGVPNVSPTNPRYQRLIGIWKKLPLWLTRIVGPWVAGALG